MSVVLTDYPKTKNIEANMRGVQTDKLIAMRKQLFHTLVQLRKNLEAGDTSPPQDFK